MPMSKEEIAFTIQQMRDKNDATHPAHYDRVIERMCNYVGANLDDFMEYYEDCEDDGQPYDIYLKKDFPEPIGDIVYVGKKDMDVLK